MQFALTATVLILCFGMVRILLPTIFDLRMSRAEGTSRRAKFRAAFVFSIVIGATLEAIGVFAALWLVRDLGVVIVLASVPILITGIVAVRNDSRRSSKT